MSHPEPLATANYPGKVILFGEHAVVYGQPAIAAPFNTLTVSVKALPAPHGSGLAIIAPDVGLTLHIREGETTNNALVYAVQHALKVWNLAPSDLTLEVRSTIPMGGGFGSGAAVSAALIRAMADAIQYPLDTAALNALVFDVEKLHHGTPSGIDNTVIVYNQPVYFIRDQALQTFEVGAPLHFLVAYSGIGTPTKETVGDVRRLYEANHERYGAIIGQIGALVNQARDLIASGSDLAALGRLMDENHAYLQELTVSSDRLDKLCTAARDAGALGAKLSGGGRGGNIIALVTVESAAIKNALRKAGAAKVWEMVLQ